MTVSGTSRSPRVRCSFPRRSKVSGCNLTLWPNDFVIPAFCGGLQMYDVSFQSYCTDMLGSKTSDHSIPSILLTQHSDFYELYRLTHWGGEQNNQLLQGCEEEGGLPVVLHTFFTNSNSYFRLLIVLIFSPLIMFTIIFFGWVGGGG